jgi:hypothetical protein
MNGNFNLNLKNKFYTYREGCVGVLVCIQADSFNVVFVADRAKGIPDVHCPRVSVGGLSVPLCG